MDTRARSETLPPTPAPTISQSIASSRVRFPRAMSGCPRWTSLFFFPLSFPLPLLLVPFPFPTFFSRPPLGLESPPLAFNSSQLLFPSWSFARSPSFPVPFLPCSPCPLNPSSFFRRRFASGRGSSSPIDTARQSRGQRVSDDNNKKSEFALPTCMTKNRV